MKNKKTWLYIGIGAVVLLVVYRMIMNRTWYLDFSDGAVNASGSSSTMQRGKDCTCMVYIDGHWHEHKCKCRKCDEFCAGAINVETQPN
jgi:hypothetical protein